MTGQGERAGSEAAGRPIRVLFVCVGNSARSIMAEALLRQAGGDRFVVNSAGTEPKGVNSLTLRVLAEIGIDASWARSESVTAYLGQAFDYVVTVCDQARESCPVFPGTHRSLHWDFEDPATAGGTEDERLAVFRRVRDEIRDRIERSELLVTRREAVAKEPESVPSRP